MNCHLSILISVVCMRPCLTRIILQCWISWTPAAIRPPPPHPRLLLQHPSSRATPPVPLHHPTPHPKAIGTAASTSQVSLVDAWLHQHRWKYSSTVNQILYRHTYYTYCNVHAHNVLVISPYNTEFVSCITMPVYQIFIVWATKVLLPSFSV